MTKTSSRRSSATASPAEPNPGDVGKVDDGPDSTAADAPQDANTPTIATASTASTTAATSAKPANPSIGESQVVGSEPMTASNSNSSILSTKASGGGGTSSMAASYGTRSTRTRTGTSRPNYAEDNALDAEFEISPNAKEKTSRKAAQAAELSSSSASEAGRSASNNPRIPSGESEQNASTQSQVDNAIPGTSSFLSTSSATTGPPPSKKRKANGQNSTAHLNGSAPSSNGGSKVVMASQIAAGFRETNMLTFDNCGAMLKAGKLIADDGTVLALNDHVYTICEPPGEPYYIGRIMAWIHVNNDISLPLESLRLNWYYRPKDIGRKVNDTRQVFASMHTDVNPLTAIRGKCEIKHKSQIENIDDFRGSKDCFYFEKLYDRYIHRYYEVVPTKAVINLPDNVKKVLDERWVYILAEANRAKEYTTASKSCKRCKRYCASNEGVDCAICRNTYHMSCVSPPLLKKPTRGFAWACGPCSKVQAKKLEARNTPTTTGPAADGEDDDAIDEEAESPGATEELSGTGQTTPIVTNGLDGPLDVSKTQITQENRGFLWRYLGIHCNVEDALDADDRIHPRASSRLGPRHQAVVIDWPGQPMQYVKAPETKRKYTKGGAQKKETKITKETVAALEAEKLARENRPKYVTDEPPGFVHRGEDLPNDDPKCTAKLLYKLPDSEELIDPSIDASSTDLFDEETRIRIVHEYVIKVIQQVSPLYHLPHMSTNLLDVAVEVLRSNSYDTEKALEAMKHVDKKIFKEPSPSGPELKRFEDGVSKFGSEWHSIKKHVKSMKAADIVRFYYTWKKSERGKHVWGNFHGRKGKKEAKRAEATKVAVKLQDDVADEYDDSAFDNDKAFEKKRGFQCKFCTTTSSRQWRRAPNTATGTTVPENPGKGPAKDKSALMVALCRRCAELWRRYAIQWEDVDELSKKAVLNGTKPFKRKIDEETIKEILAADEVSNMSTYMVVDGPPVSSTGTPVPATSLLAGTEPPRKKAKTAAEPEFADSVVQPASSTATSLPPKKKVVEKPVAPPPPPPPEPPKARILPCSICAELEPMDQHLTCKECRLSVHRGCYGVVGDRSKWTCDMCSNDKNPQVSVQYKCMLCPIEHTEHDFVEPIKASHKKKTEKDREKERLEKEKAQKDADFFRKKQEELNKPVSPREPLKRTANNNWVHVTCAVFTPEVKFGNAKALEPSEGIPSIPSSRYEDVCKICKKKAGACVACHSCKASLHVECARQAGYILGFDITPVKGSRRDQVPIVNIKGDVGTMVAAIWCKEHVPQKTVVHQIQEIADDETGQNALQLYVQKFKQADLTLTGTVRKATLINQSTKAAQPVAVSTVPNRKASMVNMNSNSHGGRNSLSHAKVEETSTNKDAIIKKICATCDVDVSPKWWSFPPSEPTPGLVIKHVNGAENVLSDSQTSQEALGADVARHAALAAAALHQNTKPPPGEPVEFQCHKCHFKKVKRESTPVPEIPAPPPPPPAPIASVEDVRLPTQNPPVIGTPGPDVEMIQAAVPPYAWRPPSSHPSNVPYNNGWPRHSPVSQVSTHVNLLNGDHPPRLPALPQSPNGYPRPPIPHSPRQNGHISHMTNGYPPPSPQRSMHMPNGSFPPYTSPRPAPHHLTNGGPPPRANDLPFTHNSSHAPMLPRTSYGPPHASPPLHINHLQRENGNAHGASNGHQENGRVNGGASASPSLRNLLS